LEPEFPVVGASATLGRNAEAGAGGADRLIAWAPAAAMVESLGAASGVPFAVSLPDGHRLLSGKGEPAFTVVFHDQTALLATLTRGHVGLLEAYFDERVDLEGDLGRAFAAVMAAGSTCARRRSMPSRTACRKIRLGAGDRFVEIGCGFGGFMLRAHETPGARGTGVNTTTEQVEWLRGEIARRGLQSELAVREADFREVDGEYDKVVSIGILEHAGRDQLADVVRAHAAFLKPGGLGMLHFIGHVGRYETELFIRKYVFPGGWVPSLADTLVAMEA